MTVTNFTVKRQGRELIGDSIARTIKQMDLTNSRIVAVVPRMLAFFAMSPERYEVVEVDVIVADEP